MSPVRLGGIMTMGLMPVPGSILLMRRRDKRRDRGEARLSMWSGIPPFPEQASTLAPRVDNVYYFFFITAVTAFFGILTSVVVVWLAIKYRTNDPLAVGARIHGSIPLEIAWSIIPFIISIVIFGWAAQVYFGL